MKTNFDNTTCHIVIFKYNLSQNLEIIIRDACVLICERGYGFKKVKKNKNIRRIHTIFLIRFNKCSTMYILVNAYFNFYSYSHDII